MANNDVQATPVSPRRLQVNIICLVDDVTKRLNADHAQLNMESMERIQAALKRLIPNTPEKHARWMQLCEARDEQECRLQRTANSCVPADWLREHKSFLTHFDHQQKCAQCIALLERIAPYRTLEEAETKKLEEAEGAEAKRRLEGAEEE